MKTIQASELRIGNIIYDNSKKKYRYVTHRIISDLASNNNPLPYSPEPVTKEWLVRFGIREFLNGCFCLDELGSNIELHDGKWFFTYSKSEQRIELKSIHQLQNLYFALKDTELIPLNK